MQIRKLLGGNATEVLLEPFPTLDPIRIPLPCALDVICNLYNVNEPATLDSARDKFAALVSFHAKFGLVVGLYEFLDVLVEEVESGATPRALFRHPRRTMDGRLGPMLTADAFVKAVQLKKQLASSSAAMGGAQHYGLLSTVAEESLCNGQEQMSGEDEVY